MKVPAHLNMPGGNPFAMWLIGVKRWRRAFLTSVLSIESARGRDFRSHLSKDGAQIVVRAQAWRRPASISGFSRHLELQYSCSEKTLG